jgi:hypothetical protein
MAGAIKRVIMASLFVFTIYWLGFPWLSSNFFKIESVGFLMLAIMAIDYVFSIFNTACSSFVLASGKNPFLFVVLLAGALNVALIVLVVPKLGVIGIPLCSLVAGLVSAYSFSIINGISLFKSLKA